MVRRAGGVLVIAGACLVLAVTSASGRLRVDGSARVPEHAVLAGTCIGPVTQPFDAQVTPGAGEGEQLWYTATYAYPIAALEACDRPHAGEVLSVDYSATAPIAATLPQFDGWDAACQAKADARLTALGFGRWLDRRDGVTVEWTPAFTLAGRVFGPDAAARAAGERWSACALASSEGNLAATNPTGPDHDANGPGQDLAGPDHDLARSPSGPLPGRCLSVRSVRTFASDSPTGAPSLDDPAIAIDCSTPHPAQVVAVATMVGGSPSVQALQGSCGRAAAYFLKAPDATFGGILDVVFVQDYSLGICLATVAGHGRLVASLLGIGAGPLPWAG